METVRWLYGLQHFGIKLGLDNIRALLRVLDHPERAFPSVIVGGTNGKGSVAAMLHAMLGAAGVRAGLFTSPHLVRPNERIRIGERDIDDDALDALLARMRACIGRALADDTLGAHPSFFEVVTAAALVAFRDAGVRAAVLEVGLGGRLDATNAVDAGVSVIVSVDLDHTKTLGTTIEQIAREKAGIIKSGAPCVSGVMRQQAASVIQRSCTAAGSPLVDARAAVELLAMNHDVFTLATRERRYDDLRLALAGRHQIDNARVALAAFEQFAPLAGIAPTSDAVRQGLAAVHWPGRLQWIRGNDGRPDLLLDGAHNPAGMRVLVSYLRGLGGSPPVALFGAMHGKLLDGMLEQLVPEVQALVITRPAVDRAEDPNVVAAEARRAGAQRIEVVDEPARALARAIELTAPGAYCLVSGSLYLVGEVLGLIERRPFRASLDVA